MTSKQQLIDMLTERSRLHDDFRCAETAYSEGRADGYSAEMNAFDVAHDEVEDWLHDNLDELLGFLRADETSAPRPSHFTGVHLHHCSECGESLVSHVCPPLASGHDDHCCRTLTIENGFQYFLRYSGLTSTSDLRSAYFAGASGKPTEKASDDTVIRKDDSDPKGGTEFDHP